MRARRRPVVGARRGFARRRDRGSMAVEVVILVPVLFAFVLLIVAGGRLVLRQGEIDSAARDAARAASLARSSGEARGAAADAVRASMGGTSCGTAVDTSQFFAGGDVAVQISCVVPFGDLGLVGLPGSTTVRGKSVAPLDQFRRTG
ncbi:MAG: TadE/TadG family type IV pilus assembly protein [Lapillicoccus sp.]